MTGAAQKMKEFIYADNAATTRISQMAFEAMVPYLTEYYGNASALYRIGRDSHKAVEDARKQTGKNISSPQSLSIMPFCMPCMRWRKMDLK